ncbi:tetratricopeptide repeat protein [Culicoidibacter larvae]|uniref:Tetratricopeptide repeat protein n=1 Tax=Culicoidibacter larvae TaxID=2579976 RepID=A0A5R8QB92_9FIRM|nr:tetratricopeptide repeat protein [Culicoidibacter larvae]TLG72895.1 tetratricopeptide repeat protein [Culicoidibacter larvae]
MLKNTKRLLVICCSLLLLGGILAGCTNVEEQKAEQIREKESAAQTFYDNKQYAEAVALYDQIVAIDDQHADAYVKRALSYIAMGNIEKAQLDLKRAEPLMQTPTGAYYQASGLTYRANKQFDQALESFDKALAIGESSTLFAQRAWVNYDLHQIDAAQNDLISALALDAGNANIFWLKAQLAADSGDYQDAIDNANRALKLDKSLADAQAIKGYAMYKLASVDAGSSTNNIDTEYKKELDAALKTEKTATVYNYIGMVALEVGDYQTAYDNFTKAIELDNRNAKVQNSSAMALHKLGKNEEALVDANTAITLDPEVAEYYYNRAQILDALNLKSAATRDYNKAVELDKKYADMIPKE